MDMMRARGLVLNLLSTTLESSVTFVNTSVLCEATSVSPVTQFWSRIHCPPASWRRCCWGVEGIAPVQLFIPELANMPYHQSSSARSVPPHIHWTKGSRQVCIMSVGKAERARKCWQPGLCYTAWSIEGCCKKIMIVNTYIYWDSSLLWSMMWVLVNLQHNSLWLLSDINELNAMFLVFFSNLFVSLLFTQS